MRTHLLTLVGQHDIVRRHSLQLWRLLFAALRATRSVGLLRRRRLRRRRRRVRSRAVVAAFASRVVSVAFGASVAITITVAFGVARVGARESADAAIDAATAAAAACLEKGERGARANDVMWSARSSHTKNNTKHCVHVLHQMLNERTGALVHPFYFSQRNLPKPY